MRLEFVFSTYSLTELFFIMIAVISNLFLVVYGISLRRNENVKHSNLILIVGFFLLLWSIVSYALPDVAVVDWTWEDLQFGFTYDFTRERSIGKALEIVLGISFLIHGKDNREPYWFSLVIGGLFISVYQVLSAFNYGILYYLLWFSNPTGLEYQSSLFLSIEFVNIELLIASMIFIFLFAFGNLILIFSESRNLKDLIFQSCLIIFGVLYLVPVILLYGIYWVGMLPGLSIGFVIGIGLYLYIMRRELKSQQVSEEVHV